MNRIIITFLLAIAMYRSSIAQTFEFRLVNQGSGIIGVQMRTTTGTAPTTANVLTDLVFGICWDNAYNVNLSTLTTAYDIEKAGSEVVTGSTRYQLFAKSATPSVFPQAWVLNTWVTIATITNSKSSLLETGTFSICPVNIQELNTNYDLKDYAMSPTGNATGVIIKAGVLPVDLLSFTASVVGTKDVLLKWTSQSEMNLAYYEVEHALEGVTFLPINQTKAIKAAEYTYLDLKAQEGVNYYRLKMMDTNGDFKYSKIVSIDLKKGDFNVEVFPNPIAKGSFVTIRANKTQPFELSVYSVDGKKVLSGTYEKEATLATKGWQSGLYIYEVTSKNAIPQKGSFSVN